MKTFVIYPQYVFYYYLSYCHLFTSWYALNHEHVGLSILPAIIMLGSIAHWRYPIHGWTYTIHKGTSYGVILFNSVLAVNAQYSREYFIWSWVAYLFHINKPNGFSGLFQNPQKDERMKYTICHTGVQVGVCVSQLYLYSGWISEPCPDFLGFFELFQKVKRIVQH